MLSRQELVYMAKICEQAERYDDMLNYIRQVAFMEQELSTEERNLFTFAYYYCVGSRKTQMRQLCHLENKVTQKVNTNPQFSAIIVLKKRILNELNDFCNEFLILIENQLLKLHQQTELYFQYQFFKCRYLKHKVDYLQDEQERDIAINIALLQFEQIYEQVIAQLLPTNVRRLQMVLDFSVFLHEILEDNKKACEICDEALIQARKEIDKELNQQEKVQIEQVLNLIEQTRNLVMEDMKE
ncbi:unnamed protein product [Paramecium pentaurelia]|uniref:14-3-3 domain-containing protein n=1 Tax=Paramecium pentaurelia TaxID=43138 RepID=A0A8S1VGY6_9CILI|nr:unnamed protein product [Paramecium pentaurelia]